MLDAFLVRPTLARTRKISDIHRDLQAGLLETILQ